MTSPVARIATVSLIVASGTVLIATWHFVRDRKLIRRSTRGWFWFGVFLFAMGMVNFANVRHGERAHQPSYYKRAVVTPEQGYAATTGFLLFGSAVILIALFAPQDFAEGASQDRNI